MASLSEKQIEKNTETLVKLIEKYVTSDRKEKIFAMLEKIGTSFYTAPASSKTAYHSAFPGGLVHHTLNVTKNLFEICQMWYPEASKESLTICGLFHDLGKSCTTDNQDNYIPNDSEWHKDKLGQMYKYNPDIRDGLTHAQRSVRLLSYYNVPLTDEEYLAILSHDGLYVDENVSFKHKMNKLSFLLHTADVKTAIIDEI